MICNEGLTGNLISVNDLQDPCTLFITRCLQLGHGQWVHIDPPSFSYQVDDRYSRL